MSVCQAHVESLLVGRRPGRGCCTLGRQRMGYGTRPHDQKSLKSEPMKSVCLSPPARPSLVSVIQPIVASYVSAVYPCYPNDCREPGRTF
jgi:hypothetical protein